MFGHDPQFPGMAAEAGLTSSSWARGPHHQWVQWQAPVTRGVCSSAVNSRWIAPSGVGLLTHYMPAHHAAGWWMDSSASLAEAEQATYELFRELKSVALTRNVLLPVGTDYTRRMPGSPISTTTGTPATPGLGSSAHCRASSSPRCARTGRAGVRVDSLGLAADPGHEPDLHR